MLGHQNHKTHEITQYNCLSGSGILSNILNTFLYCIFVMSVYDKPDEGIGNGGKIKNKIYDTKTSDHSYDVIFFASFLFAFYVKKRNYTKIHFHIYY